jgi:hypothetical protein
MIWVVNKETYCWQVGVQGRLADPEYTLQRNPAMVRILSTMVTHSLIHSVTPGQHQWHLDSHCYRPSMHSRAFVIEMIASHIRQTM